MITLKKIGFSIVLTAVVLFNVSCEKENQTNEDIKTISMLDYKTEFVEVNADEWEQVSNKYFQYSFESNIVKTYNSVKYIRVYKKISKNDFGAVGVWKELPFDNYNYEFVDNKIYVQCYDCNLASVSMFKLEIKVEGSVSASKYAEAKKTTVDQYLNVFKELVSKSRDFERGFQSVISL